MTMDGLMFGWRSSMMLMLCLPLLICICLLLGKKIEKKSCRFLAAFFFVCVWSVVPQIIGFAGFYDRWPNLTYFPFMSKVWLGALLYLHAYYLLFDKASSLQPYFLSLGVLQTSYYSFLYVYFPNHEAKWAYNTAIHEPYIMPVETLLTLSLLGFAIFSIGKWYKQYADFVAQSQSNRPSFDPVWIKKISHAMVFSGSLFLILEIMARTVGVSYRLGFIFLIIIMSVLVWLAIESVWRLQYPFPKMPFTLDNNETQNRETQDVILDEQVLICAQARMLRQKVIRNKWYLEPRFSLKELTKLVNSNELYVSRQINDGLGLNFHDFINSLRVEHARQLLQTSSLPILEIALASGFNSKATFNRVFKEQTGNTPSGIRKLINKTAY